MCDMRHHAFDETGDHRGLLMGLLEGHFTPGLYQVQVDQAAAACERAFKAGHSRQRVELLLPLIGATDIDDWPGGPLAAATAAPAAAA